MDNAVDAVLADKFGPDGIYRDEALFRRIYNGEFGDRYLDEASNYADDVIACTRDVCNYIYDTHGRFPAHAEAIHVPGVAPGPPPRGRVLREVLPRRPHRRHRTHDATWHPSG